MVQRQTDMIDELADFTDQPISPPPQNNSNSKLSSSTLGESAGITKVPPPSNPGFLLSEAARLKAQQPLKMPANFLLRASSVANNGGSSLSRGGPPDSGTAL